MTSPVDSRKLLLEINSSERVSKGLERAKDFLIQTVAEKDALSQTAETLVDRMTEVKEQAVNAIGETAEQARKSLTDTLDRASDSLGTTIQKAEKLNRVASDSIQTAMGSLVHEWMDSAKVWIDSHPLIFWMVQVMRWAIDHPILALVIALLVIFTLSSLLKALGRLVERAWISVLRAPLKLGQLLIGASSKSLSRLGGLKPQQLLNQQSEERLGFQAGSPEPSKHEQTERLADILIRLEEISQEQNQLLQEVAAIVALDKQV